jgi:hypothetical protein
MICVVEEGVPFGATCETTLCERSVAFHSFKSAAVTEVPARDGVPVVRADNAMAAKALSVSVVVPAAVADTGSAATSNDDTTIAKIGAPMNFNGRLRKSENLADRPARREGAKMSRDSLLPGCPCTFFTF